MKLHDRFERVHSGKPNSVLARDKLTEECDRPSTASKTQDLRITWKSNPNIEGSRWLVKKGSGNYLEVNSPLKLSLTETVSVSRQSLNFESDFLEPNYQPKHLRFNFPEINPKILLIENQDECRNSICSILQRQFQVIESKDSKSAIKLAQAEFPDLIVCELRMPLVDGYSILHRLRKSLITKNIPVIFVTSYSKETDVDAMQILIVDRQTIEPLTKEKLLTKINHRLNMATAR